MHRRSYHGNVKYSHDFWAAVADLRSNPRLSHIHNEAESFVNEYGMWSWKTSEEKERMWDRYLKNNLIRPAKTTPIVYAFVPASDFDYPIWIEMGQLSMCCRPVCGCYLREGQNGPYICREKTVEIVDFETLLYSIIFDIGQSCEYCGKVTKHPWRHKCIEKEAERLKSDDAWNEDNCVENLNTMVALLKKAKRAA